MKKNLVINILGLLIGINILNISCAKGISNNSKQLFGSNILSDKSINTFRYIINQIHEYHIESDSLDEKEIILNAVNGILSELDPHSMLFSKDEFKELLEHVDGEFGGIGVEMEWRQGIGILIINPIDDLPANIAGIKANDLIIEINDESIESLGYFKAIKSLRGEPGTKVKVTVFRIDENNLRKKLHFTITRGIIKMHSIKYFIDKNIAYIRISGFDKNTFDDFFKVANKLKACGIKGILLDLTNNGGGVLDTANQIADMLIKEGTIVSIKGKGSNNLEHIANLHNPNKLIDIPIVVMINEFTASAAEVLAAALQDHRRAIIIGRKSYGKGSVQTVFKLNAEYGIKITTALHYRPNGKTIQGKGITPDILIKKVINSIDENENLDDDFYRSEASFKNYIKPIEDKNKIQNSDNFDKDIKSNKSTKKDEKIMSKDSQNILNEQNKEKDKLISMFSDLENTSNKQQHQKNQNPYLKCKFDDLLIKNQTPREKLNKFIEKNMYIRGFDILQGLIISNQYNEITDKQEVEIIKSEKNK